jgi:hypothetical protein
LRIGERDRDGTFARTFHVKAALAAAASGPTVPAAFAKQLPGEIHSDDSEARFSGKEPYKSIKPANLFGERICQNCPYTRDARNITERICPEERETPVGTTAR